jgi:hypothetical protein
VTKKTYGKPVLTKVRLDLRTSVLSVCRLSLGNDQYAGNCKVAVPPCFTP